MEMLKLVAVCIGPLLLMAFGLFLSAAAGKRTPKPGRDFDERGPYDCDESDC